MCVVSCGCSVAAGQPDRAQMLRPAAGNRRGEDQLAHLLSDRSGSTSGSTVRDLVETDEPFGGKVVVLGGDFRQVLPVLPHSSRESIVTQTIPKHPLWLAGRVSVHKLVHNMRAAKDAAFRTWLLSLGNGTVPAVESEEPNVIALPPQCCMTSGQTVDDLIDAVYPGVGDHAYYVSYI